jgi:hypothetical protein
MAQKTDRGFIDNNPGIIAAVVATIIGVGFVFILVNGASHHEGGAHQGQHGAPAASHAAGSGAPAGAAPSAAGSAAHH